LQSSSPVAVITLAVTPKSPALMAAASVDRESFEESRRMVCVTPPMVKTRVPLEAKTSALVVAML